jgi:hypothetical protein
MTVARKLAETVTVAGVLAVGTVVASAATAAADPPPPVLADPAAPAPPPDPADPPQTMMGSVTGFLGQSTMSPNAGFDLLLGQSAMPAVPGGQPAAVLPDLSVLNAPQYLFGPNLKLSEQGQQSMYSAGPTDPYAPGPNGRIDAIQRAHGLWHMGMGRLEQNQLGQPLPGTAPPPGTNIPAGPEQFYEPPPPPGIPPAPPPGG